MTEREWLRGTDAVKMLKFLRGRISDRKLRLFAVACCRRLWDRLEDRAREAVEVAERHADGAAGVEDLRLAWAKTTAWSAESLTCWNNIADETWPGHFREFAAGKAIDDLRDIAGNPFREVTVQPAWRTWNDGIILQIAQGIYDDRAFDRLGILADALEDAGCTDEAILDHCRQRREHVRGCWVVDCLLEKK
jgi:hypothetical protein